MANIRFNFSNLPTSDEAALVWAREHGLLRECKNCGVHRTAMKLYKSASVHGIGRFRCTVGRETCRQYSATVDSFFEDIHLPLHKAIRLLYCFTRDLSDADTAHELCDFNSDDASATGSATIATWFHYCREIIVDLFTKIQLNKPKLGGISASGNPIIVQIDKAKFGKRKHNRGRRVEGHWVLGMVDVETGDCRMAVAENSTSETLVAIIKENVAVGSEVHTDCFHSYTGLTAAGYIHKTVIHRVEFMGTNGTQTQKIESNFRPAEDWMRGRGRFHDDDFADRLCEYLWRQFCRRNKTDQMASLMEAIRMQYVFE